MASPSEFNRDATPAFKKRSKTLKKNAGELATLCDIQAMLICFGPKQEAVTWPEKNQDIQTIISRYRSPRPAHGSGKIRSLDAKLQEVDAMIGLLARQNQSERDCKTEVDEDEVEEDEDSQPIESGEITEDEDEDEAFPKTRDFIASLERYLALGAGS